MLEPTTYPLDRALPPEMVTHSSGGLAGYRSFPVFSRPWFLRRMRVFGPLALLIAIVQGVGTALLLRDPRTGLLAGVCSVVIWFAIMIAGPGFATLVRHRRLPRRAERAAVVLAILAGLGVSFAGQAAADYLSHRFVTRPLIEAKRLPENVPAMLYRDSGVSRAFQILVQGIIFLGLGGGPALRAYFAEQNRWRAGLQQREMASLRRQKSEADLRLTVLQAQVEPHFLFNTLASVRSLVRQDPGRAEATVDALVDHLRATLPKFRAGSGEVRPTLADQIEICASYLAVMKVRMGERLQYDIDVPAELRALAFPPLILISLVENAIKHGIEPKTGGGHIWISAEIVQRGAGPAIAVSVEDDGLGLRPGLSEGVGLSNVRAQLATRFGERAKLTLTSRDGGGVIATVSVPSMESLS
jgi:two-component sensor histidine kinase